MSLSNPTILLVDDEERQRDFMRRSLLRGGYTVLEASDYDAALAVHEKHLGEIDLLLIDLSLPGGSGYDLSNALRSVEPNLGVLFISGQTGAEMCKFFDMPLTDLHFLQKPFRPADLLRRVKSVLSLADPAAGYLSAY